MTDIVERYLECWNATDADERAARLAATFTAGATYVDPLAATTGLDELDAAISGVHAQFPGFVFTRVGEPDTHHDVARFNWGLGSAGVEPIVIGFDVVTTDPDGLINSVTGFLDRVPA
jgi:hypothetical protein